MFGRIACVASVVLTPCMLISTGSHAQDVPGIEICTVEKTMERRTSCLQSNVEFLQKTIAKLSADHQQKLDAAKAQIEVLEDLKKKADAPPAKDSVPPVKDGVPPVKDGGK